MKSGIYKITCLVNSKFYIGSAVKLNDRWRTHLYHLRRGDHNRHLQNTYNKYGESNFQFEVLEYCEKDQLLIREQFYIDTLNPQFNVRKIAEANYNITISKEGKKRLSEFWLGKKRPQTENHKTNLRKALKGKLIGRTISQQHKDKLSFERIGNGNPMFGSVASNAISVLRINSKGKIEEFTSIKEAADSINTSYYILRKKLLAKTEHQGYMFKFKAD